MTNSPVLFGTIFGFVSALGYSAANVCLRSVAGCDPIWVSCVKATPTVVLLGAWLLLSLASQNRNMPQGRFLVILVLSALFMHVAGNVPFQWSLGVVGVALATSLTLGSIIISGAILGRIFLGEPITVRAATAIAVLGVAVFVLALGAGEASGTVTHEARGEPTSAWQIVGGVCAACLAGFSYAQSGVVIRHGFIRGRSISGTLWTVSTVGVVSLGVLSVARLGTADLLNTSWSDFQMMLAAGLFTTLAFLTLAKALQLTTVNYINTLNASQAAMCAVAGVWFFSEPSSVPLWTGVALTACGLILMDRRRYSYQKSNDTVSPVASTPPSILQSEPLQASLAGRSQRDP